jgi:hypothetical protein
MNAAGQTAWVGTAFHHPFEQPTDSVVGLWGENRAGELKLIAHTGQVIEVAPNDAREIVALDFASGTGGEDGRPRGFNDLGQVVFRARFRDGSGAIFLSDVLTVPEPLSLVLWLAAAHYCRCVRLLRQSPR